MHFSVLCTCATGTEAQVFVHILYKFSNVIPSGCDSSGFQSKTLPDSCSASAWPSLCKQTAPGSSLRLAHGSSGSYPGESGPQHSMTTLISYTAPADLNM